MEFETGKLPTYEDLIDAGKVGAGSKLAKAILRLGMPVDAWADTPLATKAVVKAAMREVGMCILMPLFTSKVQILDTNPKG